MARNPHWLNTKGMCIDCERQEPEEDSECLVRAAVNACRQRQLWLLEGDLDALEFAISDYIWRWGQHLPGVHQETRAGTPVAVANMAMTVIRKNVQRIEKGRPEASPVPIGDGHHDRQLADDRDRGSIVPIGPH